MSPTFQQVLGFACVVGGCGSTLEDDACKYERSIGGTIVEGRAVLENTPVPVPFKIAVHLETGVVASSVFAGDRDGFFVPGQLVNIPTSRWEILLYPSDIEEFRALGEFTASIPIAATDPCETTYPIGTSTLALGPPLGVVVSDLMIAAEPTLPDCYITPSGQAPRFKVSASPSSRGGTVTLNGTQGTWQSGTSSMNLTLMGPAGGSPTALASFTPTKAGVSQIVAFAGGALSNTISLVVADNPTVSVTTLTPARSVVSWLDFLTAGNFESCTVEESVPGTTTVTAVHPGAGVITGTTTLEQTPTSCDDPETIRLSVKFTSEAPDGATITLRCNETSYGRAIASTLTVANRVDIPVTGLTLGLSAPLPDCYVPSGGAVTPVIRLDADSSSAGGSVTLTATHGTWAAAQSGQASTSVQLGAGASGLAVLSPTTAGTAVVTATTNAGSTLASYQLIVADPPSLTVTDTTPARGTTAWIDFTTAGNFDTCSVVESVSGAATATIASPPLGPLTSMSSVRQVASACDVPESVRIGVSFAAGAPDGATITVRCNETAYGRSVSTTLTVGM